MKKMTSIFRKMKKIQHSETDKRGKEKLKHACNISKGIRTNATKSVLTYGTQKYNLKVLYFVQ